MTYEEASQPRTDDERKQPFHLRVLTAVPGMNVTPCVVRKLPALSCTFMNHYSYHGSTYSYAVRSAVHVYTEFLFFVSQVVTTELASL